MDLAVPPKDFALGVLYIAKKAYGDDARYIPRTRAVKLVCLAADEIGFEAISRGWYRFGLYSFRVDSILSEIFKESLLDTEVPEVVLPEAMKRNMERFVTSVKGQFKSTRDNFWRWIHYQIAPEVYRDFYRSHEEFLRAIDMAIDSPSRLYKSMGEVITRYNRSLQHVSQDVLELFFSFTDLLEDLLLVCKRRGADGSDVRQLLKELRELYVTRIYPSLTPFERSLKGADREHELRLFEDRRMKFCEEASKEIIRIKDRMRSSGLMPTLEEIDMEIAERLDEAGESELQELRSISRVSAC